MRMTATAASLATLVTALLVIVFGVLATSGVYGSRLAWLLGVALPLLAITMLLTRLSSGGSPVVRGGTRHPTEGPTRRVGRGVFVVAFSFFALPAVLVGAGLAAYALLFAVYAVRIVV